MVEHDTPPADMDAPETLIGRVGRGEYRLRDDAIVMLSWAGCAAVRSAIADVAKREASEIKAHQRLRVELGLTTRQLQELVDGLETVFGVVVSDAADERFTVWDCYDQADRQLSEPYILALIDVAQNNLNAGRDVNQALEMTERAERLVRLAFDADSELVARCLYCQGTALLLLERPDEAFDCYQESLEIRRRIHGEWDLHVASAMHNIAVSFERRGRFAEAEDHYRRAIAICDRELGPDFYDTQLIVENLGSLLVRIGRRDEGQQLLRRALDVSERSFGRAHRQTASMIASVAWALYGQGELAEAETLLRESLELCAKLIGVESPQVVAIHNNLAVVLSDQGNHQEALGLAQEAARMSASNVGLSHPTTVAIRNNLAVIREKMAAGSSEAEWRDLVTVTAEWPANDPIRQAVLQRRFVPLPVAA